MDKRVVLVVVAVRAVPLEEMFSVALLPGGRPTFSLGTAGGAC